MNISCIRSFVVWIHLFGMTVFAQNDTDVFHEHEFAARHSMNETYSLNFGLSSRAFTINENDLIYRLRQVQISHFSSLKLNLKHSIGLGIMYRNRNAFEDSSNEIRLTQQFNQKSIVKRLRFGHRFRSEQRFFDRFTEFRFRYRLAVDIPLQGLKLDTGETYFILTTEGLLTNAKIIKPEIEYRLSPSIGILLSEDFNVEFGIELRLDKLNIQTDESIFFNTSIDLKL